jgi:hypothetical protein
VRFTVNLSVIRRDEWTTQTAANLHQGQRPTPTIHYGSWADQSRIGTLTPSGEDEWWRIMRGVKVDDVRDDAIHDLLIYAVPWLGERVG